MIRYNGEDLGGGMRLKCEAPVFEIGFETSKVYPNGDKLPGVWITDLVKDDEGNELGRTYTYFYPEHDYDDETGDDALWYGCRYYDEGMSYTDPADHDKRIECFQAAELLYRHAAGRGNAWANLNLGYVYSYDRCEGKYWVDPFVWEPGYSYPREERAFECLSAAAQAELPEACYKLGDLYKQGTGCDPDAAAAFRCYVRASELAQREKPVILGSIALRLADCYEEGFGCQQDFTRALDWYRQAVEGLEAAVDAGEAWYEKALASARAGLKRCRQEV